MRWRIYYFVVTSLLVHAALLATWTSIPIYPVTLPATLSSAPGLSVVLQQADKQNPQPVQQKRQVPHKLLAQKQPGYHLFGKTNRIKPVTTIRTQQTTASSLSAELQQQQIRDRVLGRIRNHLDQYFVYPLLAQREGWQGRVLLAFSVESNGAIRNIHVSSGSGYAILDHSAVTALSRIEQISEASDWLHGTRLNLQMPVIFHLQGG